MSIRGVAEAVAHPSIPEARAVADTPAVAVRAAVVAVDTEEVIRWVDKVQFCDWGAGGIRSIVAKKT